MQTGCPLAYNSPCCFLHLSPISLFSAFPRAAAGNSSSAQCPQSRSRDLWGRDPLHVDTPQLVRSGDTASVILGWLVGSIQPILG